MLLAEYRIQYRMHTCVLALVLCCGAVPRVVRSGSWWVRVLQVVLHMRVCNLCACVLRVRVCEHKHETSRHWGHARPGVLTLT